MSNSLKPKEFQSRRIFLLILIVGLFAVALGIRTYDLDDPPLDFHSTRQLRSLIIARGMYFQGLNDAPEQQRELAMGQWQSLPVIEPPIFERFVAFTYRLVGREVPWISRIYSSLFWLAGGFPLFLLARKLTSPAGGVLTLAYYLFLPYGIIASRSFQPDPLMVSLIIFSWWAFYRWFHDQTWGNTLLAGILLGLAIFVKSVAVLMLFGGILAIILDGRQLFSTLRNKKAWIVAGLAILPTLIFMLYGFIFLDMTSQFEGRFFPEMLVDPAHYVRWLFYAMNIVGPAALIGGLLGVMLFRKKSDRSYVFGFWMGYVVYGLVFPYHFITHDYYHLPLIPLIALCLAPLGEIVSNQIRERRPGKLSQVVIVAIFVVAVVIHVWEARVTLAQEDYRHEPPYWRDVGQVVGQDLDVVALSQDYGNRIAYYGWVNTTNWPGTGQQNYRELRGGKPLTFQEQFERYTQGQDAFLVTRLQEFEDQTELSEHLNENYPVIAEGQGYILFDLNTPLPKYSF